MPRPAHRRARLKRPSAKVSARLGACSSCAARRARLGERRRRSPAPAPRRPCAATARRHGRCRARHLRVSAWTRRKASIGRPSRSAAICGKLVSWPCPLDCVPSASATVPSASKRTAAHSPGAPREVSRKQATPRPRSMPRASRRRAPRAKPAASAAPARGRDWRGSRRSRSSCPSPCGAGRTRSGCAGAARRHRCRCARAARSTRRSMM